jgi:cytochrome c peroxidase
LAVIFWTALPLFGSTAVTTPPVPSQYAVEANELDASWSTTRAALGKRLFHEPRLSRDASVSCAECHRPELAFTDGRPTAKGVRGQVGARNTPTLVNRALGRSQFWDGRAATLEEQALGPIENPAEMDLPIAEALARLGSDPAYQRDFQLAFGGGPTRERLALALSAYERTIYSVDAPFDRFIAGDHTALDASAQRGLALFGGRAKCAECHTGVNFTDEAFHCLGVSVDEGRGKVTGKRAEDGAFRTPTLREVAHTAPYMHNGSLKTLAEVVEYYDRGGDPHPNLDAKMTRLNLTAQEKADLVAFMRALSGRVVEGSDRAGSVGR